MLTVDGQIRRASVGSHPRREYPAKSGLPAVAGSESYARGYRPACASRVHGQGPAALGQRRLRGGYYLGGLLVY